MNLGLRTLLVIVAVVCFVIAIFSDVHQLDWMAIGLACWAGSILVGDLGLDRPMGRGRSRG